MKFRIHAVHAVTQEVGQFVYDNETSVLIDEVGNMVVPIVSSPEHADAPVTSPENPLGKTSPRVLKISLGLSCNFECEYCSQRFVPRAAETNPGDVTAFVDGLDGWVTTPPERVEFWGGEPLVYIKTLVPLAEAIRAKYPDAAFSIITNGSLLNAKTNEWLDRMGFAVGISHDGPGQHVRGPDPLKDPDMREAIMDLYVRLAPQGRVSFNAMVNRSNPSRAAIQQFFVDLTGDPNVAVGEGGFVDAYDQGGMAQSLQPSDMHGFRSLAYHEIRTGRASNISAVRMRIQGFIDSLRTLRPASTLGQKCGMDKPDRISVDLRGNVLTCQNVSASSTAPNGQAHRIGHVSDLAAAKLTTATHWSHRAECTSCPVLQICEGSCMFLQGLLWDRSCDNAYSDAVAIFAAGIEFLTGYVPVYIDGDFREDRRDIFGLVNGVAHAPPKRVIPIQPVAA